MRDMEIVARKKIARSGKSSLVMPLPSSLAEVFGVTAGSTVEYYKEGDTLVLKFPDAAKTPSEF